MKRVFLVMACVLLGISLIGIASAYDATKGNCCYFKKSSQLLFSCDPAVHYPPKDQTCTVRSSLWEATLLLKAVGTPSCERQIMCVVGHTWQQRGGGSGTACTERIWKAYGDAHSFCPNKIRRIGSDFCPHVPVACPFCGAPPAPGP